jgi:hypothetical protein
VLHHAGLAEGERGEDPDHVQLDQPGDVGLEHDDEQAGGHGQQQDAVAVDEPVAAGVQLPWQEPVLGEDRAEQREGVVGRVRGQEQDADGHHLHVVEGQAAAAEHGGGHLREDAALHLVLAELDELTRRVVGVPDVGDHRERGDAREHREGDAAHERQRRGGVAPLGAAEGRDAVGDRLDPGQGGAPGGERAQREEDQGRTGEVPVPLLGHDRVVGALGPRRLAGQRLEQAVRDHRADAQDEPVRRDGERPARLPDAAQVHRRQERDEQQRQRDPVVGQALEGADDVFDAGRHRHRDGEHVVDEQGARHDPAAALAEVGRRDLVVAAAAGVGAHELPVGQDDRGQHHDHARGEVGRQVEVGQAAERQDDEQLLRGVGDARQRVAREDRQGEVLAELLLALPVAAQRSAEHEPLDDVAGPTHVRRGYGGGRPGPGRRV